MGSEAKNGTTPKGLSIDNCECKLTRGEITNGTIPKGLNIGNRECKLTRGEITNGTTPKGLNIGTVSVNSRKGSEEGHNPEGVEYCYNTMNRSGHA